MMYKKKKLYLDIDDTVLNTEGYIREVLGGKWVDHEGLLYLEYDNMFDEEIEKVTEIKSNYNTIPYISGAEEGIKVLDEFYDVVFCSSSFSEEESTSKIEWADGLGFDIIVCDGFSKGDIDMSGAIIVDDNTLNLDETNADRKICYYHKGNFFGLNGSEIVFNWSTLLDRLCSDREKK